MAEDTQNHDETETDEQLDPEVQEPEELVSVDEFLVTRHAVRPRGTIVPVLPASRRDENAESDWAQSSTHTDGRVLSVVWTRRVKVKESELRVEPDPPQVAPAQAPSTGVAGFAAPVPPTPGYAVVREHGSMGGFSVRERGVATVAPSSSGAAPLRAGTRGFVSGGAEVNVRPYQGDLPPMEGQEAPAELGYNPPGRRSRVALPQSDGGAFGSVAYRPRAGVTVTGSRGVRQQRSAAPIDPRVIRHEHAAPVDQEEPTQPSE